MRRAEIKLTEVYAQQSSKYATATPVVPVVTVAELSMRSGPFVKVPAVRRARGKVNGNTGGGMRNIGLMLAGGMSSSRSLATFDVWAEGGSRPPLLTVAFETAERLRTWMETIPEGEERAVPEGMIPDGLRLSGFFSRELPGEWLTWRGGQMTYQREQRELQEQAKARRHAQRDAFEAVADRAFTMLDVEVKPGRDHYGIHPDHTVAQLPVRALIAMLDELERARDGTGPAASGGAGSPGSAE